MGEKKDEKMQDLTSKARKNTEAVKGEYYGAIQKSWRRFWGGGLRSWR